MERISSLARQRSLSRSLCTFCWTRRYVSRRNQHTRGLSRPSRLAAAFSTNTPHAATIEPVSHSRHEKDLKEEDDPPQAYPLSGYYSELLSTKYPRTRRARATRNLKSTTLGSTPTPNPKGISVADLKTKKDKMSIVFGSRLAGPGQSTRYNPDTMPPESTWKTVGGVPIPPQPAEPDNCCMSGCAHCVWDDYRDDMEQWAARVREAQAKMTRGGPQRDMRQRPRAEVNSASASMDGDGGGSEANWVSPSAGGDLEDDLFAGIPVGIREFMKTEKRLREKHRKEREQGVA
jgi:hypothetical protein